MAAVGGTFESGSTSDWVLISIAGSLLVLYHIEYARRLFRSPHTVSLGVNLIERTRWVRSLMTGSLNGAEILAVQSLRNAMMAASFLSTTTFLGLVYTLNYWLNLTSFYTQVQATTLLWQAKVLSLAIVLFCSFFLFAISMRMFSHASFLVGIRLPSPAELEAIEGGNEELDLEALDSQSTVCCKIAWTSLMDRGARSHSHLHIVRSTLSLVGRATSTFFFGMRFLYLLLPFGAWVFFGSAGLLVGSIITLFLLYFSDFV